MKRYFQLKRSLTFAIAIAAISLVGCEKYVIESTVIDPAEQRSFTKDILPIFVNHNCTDCHPKTHPLDLEAVNAYTSLKSRGCISGTPPETAKLYKKFTTTPPHKNIILLDKEKQYILYWITQGAKDN